MPTVLSKLRDNVYGREWSFPYNCYEVGHGWTPYCTSASFDVGFAAFKNTLPLYTSLYLFTQLGLQRKYDLNTFKETAKSILTSSFFIGFNFMSCIGTSCLIRNNTDRYYYRMQCFIPGFIGSYMALFIERPSRRAALAFYLANMSTELLYKYAVQEGYFKSLPHGETILFALGMACWTRFVRINGFGHDPVSSALKYLIGPYEAKRSVRAIKANPDESLELDDHQNLLAEKHDVGKGERSTKKKKLSALAKLDNSLNDFLNTICECHEVCPHKGVSCIHYSLTPTFTRFLMGYVGRSLLYVSSKPLVLLKTPGEALWDGFTSRSAVNFGLFLGSFVGITKAVHCILRRFYGKQEVWHSAVAGGLSGMSMLFAPRSTLSTYIIWKCLEQYFFLAVKNGKIKRADQCIALTYAISANTLMYMFAIEPGLIRSSYMKFMDEISDHRLHQINRIALDIFSDKASKGYEDWFPNLDPKYMSREFHELIFNWLIQPYE